MTSKAILNNVKEYKRREASLDPNLFNKQVHGHTKLPSIKFHDNKLEMARVSGQNLKFIKSSCQPLDHMIPKMKFHSRYSSIDLQDRL